MFSKYTNVAMKTQYSTKKTLRKSAFFEWCDPKRELFFDNLHAVCAGHNGFVSHAQKQTVAHNAGLVV